MDYGEILTKAWKIVWKFKVLWLFGILASFGGGGNGSSRSSRDSNETASNFDSNSFINVPPELKQAFQSFEDFMSNLDVGQIVTIIIIIFLIALLFWIIGILGKNGITLGAKLADEGIQKLTFIQLLSDSSKFFWRIVGFNILSMIGILIILILPIIFMISISSVFPAGPFLLACCFLLPLLLWVGTILEFGTIAIVVEDCGIRDGFLFGWDVVKSNFWKVVFIAVLLAVIMLIASIIIGLPSMAALLPVLIPAIEAYKIGVFDIAALQGPFLLSLGLCCLVYPITLVANGILTSYQFTGFTLTYLRLTRKVKPLEAQPEVMDVLPPAAGAV